MMPQRGLVRSAVGGVYEVELDDGELIEAVLRGRIKRDEKSGDRVVTGDRVVVERAEGGRATIAEVEPRRSLLARRAPGRNVHRSKPIAANLDQVLPVFATAHPEPNRRMLDRFLVLAESSGLSAVIIINKVDLVGTGTVRDRFRDYESAGYPLLLTSAKDGSGLDALRDRICGRISVFTGPSGAGKSSLLNALEPGLGLRTAAVSKAVGKGRHTTVASRLIPLACGGYVLDTPGLREVGLWRVPAASLDDCFPEFRPYLGHCRFGSDCSHTHEPDCALRDAVAGGAVSEARYESYRALYAGDAEAM
ncbi:MAG: ribosome small subunit-dependent GTPase A [Longimicrobiales bacterium]